MKKILCVAAVAFAMTACGDNTNSSIGNGPATDSTGNMSGSMDPGAQNSNAASPNINGATTDSTMYSGNNTINASDTIPGDSLGRSSRRDTTGKGTRHHGDRKKSGASSGSDSTNGHHHQGSDSTSK